MSMADIAQEVAERYGLTATHLRKAKCAHGTVGEARREAMARSYALGRSNMQVARYFGLKDHTAVIYARRKFAELVGVAAE